MTIRPVTEGKPAYFDDVVLEDLPPDLPEGVKLLSRDGQLGLLFDGVVGSVPLRNGDTVQVEPKIGEANFLYMLFRCEGDQRTLQRQYDELVEYATDKSETLSSLAARRMVNEADRILRQGPLTARRRIVRHQQSVSGRVNVLKTALAVERGSPDPVVTTLLVKTTDTAENRLIADALRRSAQYLDGEEAAEFARAVGHRWTRRLAGPGNSGADLDTVDRRSSRGEYGGPRSYYSEALLLARIILGAMGLSAVGAGAVQGDAMLLNASDVFERYLRRVIADHYGSLGFMVAKGGPFTHSLYVDGNYELEPDIVIWRNGITLVADAKYKHPTSDDHYQMLAYLRAFGTSTGLLLSPHYRPSAGVSQKSYSTPDGLTVTEVRLSTPRWPARCDTAAGRPRW